MNWNLGLSPAWWLLLPLLILPIWWLRQRRESAQRKILATAKFLAAANPQLVRVWRWREWLLMLLRCVLLIIVLAYLASLFVAWRGDTVLVADGVDSAWLQQQLKETGLQDAKQQRFCERRDCDIQSTQILYWLEQKQAWWKADARILIAAKAGQLPLNAELPQLRLSTEVRIQADARQAPTRTHHLMLRSDRPELWQALFRAFTVAGDGRDEYIWQQQSDAKTDLIIWDSNEVPPANWHATYWWMRRPADGIPTNLVAQDNPILVGLKLRQYQQGKVRYWLTDETGRWPFTSVHETRQWFSAWQHSKAPQMDFAFTGFTLPRAESAVPGQQENTRRFLLMFLLVVFALERMVSHVKRL